MHKNQFEIYLKYLYRNLEELYTDLLTDFKSGAGFSFSNETIPLVVVSFLKYTLCCVCVGVAM